MSRAAGGRGFSLTGRQTPPHDGRVGAGQKPAAVPAATEARLTKENPVTRSLLLLPAAVALALGPPPPARGQAPKTYLLKVGKGQTFTDIGSDDKTRPEPVDNQKELGGKALKVVFAAGDTVGDRAARVTSWKPFTALRFDALNPGKEDVALVLNVFHARTTNYNTRVVVPVKLRPRKNEVSIGIDELANVNGSAPALTSIRKWFLADEAKKGPTVYFGDFW